MKKSAKMMSMILAGAMAVSLTACGGGNADQKAEPSKTEAAGAAEPSAESGEKAAKKQEETKEAAAEGEVYQIGVLQLVQHTALDAANEGFIAALH